MTPVEKKTKLRDVLRDIYAPLKMISGRTLALYEFTLDAFGRFLGHEPTIADLEKLTVARFLADRVRQRAAATASKDRSQLRAIWEFLARHQMTDSWPAIPLIKVPDRIPECWLTDEFVRLLSSAALERTCYEEIPAALWWRALLLLAYDTGERCHALISIQWGDVRGGCVLFRAENRKGSRRDILRELSPATQAALEAIRGARKPGDQVFPWPRSRSYLWKRLEIILSRAGLPAKRRDKFHKIRKTTASYYEASGNSAQRLLDHADPATTRKYLDPRVVKGVAAPDVIPRVG